jgi:endonuclease-3 related protein
MKSIYDIYCMLFQAYGMQNWWPAESEFEMMAGAILTQNTSWSNVERALGNFGVNLTPEFIQGSSVEELGAIVRPSGFFNQKAVRLKGIAKWFEKYDFSVEAVKASPPEKIRNELLGLDGIGFETADSIMLYAFEKPYLVIDAYTVRVFTRLGFKLPGGYDETRQYFENKLPYKNALFNEFHALIVRHAKLYCKKQPCCAGCPLEDECLAHHS